MVRILIVEDELQALEGLKRMLTLLNIEVEVVGEARSVKAAKCFLERTEVDLVLADVHLEDGDCFEFLDKMKDKLFKIIFITASKQNALKAFQYNTENYLLKPIDPKALSEALNNVLTQKEQAYELTRLKAIQKNEPNRIQFKHANKTLLVDVDSIIRFEAQGAYTLIVTEENQYLLSRHLGFYEHSLAGSFLRVHHSHIINTKYIVHASKKKLTLANADSVPISTRKKQHLKQWLETLIK